MEKDPLFAHPTVKLTLDEERSRTLKQIFRVLEYGFVTEEDILEDPVVVNILHYMKFVKTNFVILYFLNFRIIQW